MKYDGRNPTIKNIGFHTNHERNQIGLDNAYEAPSKLFIDNNRLYIAGTDIKNPQDIWDDISKVPFGLTRYSQRYKDADKLLSKHPEINEISGHSLGSAVTQELVNRHPERHFDTTLYAAPFVQIGGKKHENRFRHAFDPFSMFDWGAQTVGGSINPLKAHDYSNY